MNFEAHINGKKPVVVDFFATWCAPCKYMVPILEQLKKKTGDSVTVLKMDVDKNPSYANKYNIQAVPTVIIFRDGKIIWRKSGVASLHELLDHLSFHMSP